MSYVKSPVELGLVTDTTGIYSMTEETWIDAMKSTGFLQFGLGDTVEATIAERQLSLSSSKNVFWQKYLLDTISKPGYRDHALHKVVRQSIAAQLCRADSNRHSELFKIAVEKCLIEEFIKSNDFEPIRIWLNEKIRKCAAKLNPNHIKQEVELRGVQDLVIKKILSAVRQNGIVTNFVCELAARIGKTILFLSLAKTMREEFGHESMFIMAYGVGLSVKTSYKDEIGKYINFAYLQFIDAAEADAEEQYKQAIVDGKMPVVFISLNPEVEAKYEWINKLAGTHIALLEETDFGTHTDGQVEKVDYILEKKTVTRINASGTNIGRLAKAFGKNAIDEIISVPYCMVEQDSSIPNVVVRRFYNMLFSGRINKLLEDFDKDLLPNLTKILAKPYSQQKFISALFQDIFGYQPLYGFNISDQAGEEIKHSMLFVNISKLAMEQLAEVIEKACSEHKVLILNGDYTNNKEAEGLTKEELVRLQNGYYEGRDKLLVITNMMGTRSYSIPEIQACLFMQEGGDVYPYMQKYSRCLTPGYGKKFGHIFDFAFDQSKTRNSVMSVAVEAALLIRQKGKTYPEAVREVMNSVNIKDMISGKWMDADTIIKAFEDNNKLLEIANAHTRITIEDLTSEEIEAFGELAKRSSSSKAEKSKIDKIIETGKTFESGKSASGKAKKDLLKAVVEKAVRMINGSATTVLALGNYQGESFLECVDLIENNAEMYEEFVELYGVGPDTIKRLAHRLEISTLDMIVRMSKYNTTQKHIANNALAILKDDAKLWFKIFGNRELKRFIKSKHCKNILVVAGGHGSEIDVLVEIFGIDIINKIVYNDKYSFLCNQIKRKYPSIVVMQGDFIELEFDMKFDVIVGNPPYQAPKKGDYSFWARFVDGGYKLLNDDGYMSMIIPAGWMSPTNDIRQGQRSVMRDIFAKENTSYINIDPDLGKKYFPGIGQKFTWFVLEKGQYISTKIDFGNSTIDIDLSKMSMLAKDTDSVNVSILSKLSSNPDKWDFTRYIMKESWDDITFDPLSDHLPRINGNSNHLDKIVYSKNKCKYHDNKKVVLPYNGSDYRFVVDTGSMGCTNAYVMILSDLDLIDSAITYFTHPLLQWLGKNKFTQYNEGALINSVSKIDLTKVVTSADVYQLYNLTPEEIEYVEASVK